MTTASLQEVKQELNHLPSAKLVELCIALAKYKKENKEFLGYLLFESYNKNKFIASIKMNMDSLFSELSNQKNFYFLKKNLRKILRIVNKYCKYIGDKSATAELLIYYCSKIKEAKIPLHQSIALENIYLSQLKKIKAIINILHEDLQQDYFSELTKLDLK